MIELIEINVNGGRMVGQTNQQSKNYSVFSRLILFFSFF